MIDDFGKKNLNKVLDLKVNWQVIAHMYNWVMTHKMIAKVSNLNTLFFEFTSMRTLFEVAQL